MDLLIALALAHHLHDGAGQPCDDRRESSGKREETGRREWAREGP